MKQDIIMMHIGAVRYEKDVFGILDAMKYYFGDIIKTPSLAESFFIIERISNIKSGLLTKKIYTNIMDAYAQNYIEKSDISELIDIYKKQVGLKRVLATDEALERLTALLKNIK